MIDLFPTWTHNLSNQAGPRVPLPQDPLGLFSLFFDKSLVSLIVDKTNRYAEQSLQDTDKVWSTNAEEIQAYMGFMILIGINHLPEIRDYWSVSEYFRYAPIAYIITRDRFEEITRYLHFVDNDSLPARGENKVDPVISAFKTNFQSAYYPHCELSIDEAMIPFKGRSSMKQYVHLKPVKRGFKAWAMADACNGYVYDLTSIQVRLGTGRRVWERRLSLLWQNPSKGGTISCILTTTLLQSFDEVTLRRDVRMWHN